MSTLAPPPVRKRIVVGWRQLERQRSLIRSRQRPGAVLPKRIP